MLRQATSRRLRFLGIAVGVALILWLGKIVLFPTEYDAFTVREQPLRQSVVATGRVRAESRVRLGAASTSTVARVPVIEGDSVRAGQVLILLDDAEWRAAVAQARATVAQAEAALDAVVQVRAVVTEAARREAESALRKARADFDRINRLRETGNVSDDEYERVQQIVAAAQTAFDIADAQAIDAREGGSDRRSAEAAVSPARASVAAASARLLHGRIVAPSAGVVLTRSVESGDLVQPGRVLMEMGVRTTAQLVVVPDERNLASLAVGQHAMAVADAFPRDPFPARVAYVSPAVDATQGTVEVRLTIDSAPAFLRPDLTVSVEIEVAQNAQALVVPLDAVREPRSLKPWVLVHRDGRAVRQDIRIGARGERFVEVLEGIEAGEVVLRPGLRRIEPGARVRARVTEST